MKTFFNRALRALVILFVFAPLHAAEDDFHTTLDQSESFDWSNDSDDGTIDNDTTRALTEFIARSREAHNTEQEIPPSHESEGSGASSRLSERVLARSAVMPPADMDFMRAMFRRRPVSMPNPDELERDHHRIRRDAHREERDAHDMLNMTSLGATALGTTLFGFSAWSAWDAFHSTHAARAAARGLASELAGMEGIASELSTLEIFSDNAVAVGKAGLKIAPYIAALVAMGWGYRKVRSFLMDDAEVAREKAMVALEYNLEQILERFGIIERDITTLGRGLAEIGETAEQGADIAAQAYSLMRAMDTGERVLLPVIRESFNNTKVLAAAVAAFARASKKDRARPLAEVAEGIVVNTGTMMASIDTTLTSIAPSQGRRRRHHRRVRAATVHDGERPGTSAAAGAGGDDDDAASVVTNATGRSWRKPGTWFRKNGGGDA